jgi:hypothetical protein
MKMEQSVPKHRHIEFRRRGITQKKIYLGMFGSEYDAESYEMQIWSNRERWKYVNWIYLAQVENNTFVKLLLP